MASSENLQSTAHLVELHVLSSHYQRDQRGKALDESNTPSLRYKTFAELSWPHAACLMNALRCV
jgi:hypothetical protein